MTTISVDHLRQQVRGEIILPGDSRYESAPAVHHAMMRRAYRPAFKNLGRGVF